MSEENKVIARRYFVEIMNMANMDTLRELLSPDFIFTLATHPEPYRGPDGFKELVEMLHSCFPDFYINIQDMVASGDTVVTRWRGGGTHKGGALHTVKGDIPASGTRKEAKLYSPRHNQGLITLRRVLSNYDTRDAIENLFKLLNKFPDNGSFLKSMCSGQMH